MWLLLVALLLVVSPVLAQEDIVTDDQVNAIAQKLYCPVCENIPLDACGTAACDDWRNEIRLQLESGMTEDQIINDFVTRFGDRVVGTPQDPTLRALSLVTPYLFIAAGVIVGVSFVLRHRSRSTVVAPADVGTSSPYYDQLQKDLDG
jgi:cytochrome c-type biogenesis protein CcmH